MFRMIRQGRIEWQAAVSPKFIGKLAIGEKATIPTPGGSVTGTIRLISPTVDQNTGRLVVYVSLPQTDSNGRSPKAGLYESGVISVGSAMAMTVPQSAVVLKDGLNYVFTLNADDTVSRQRVVPDRRMDDAVEITGGLDPKAEVVQVGGAFLSDGATVKVVPATGATQ